MHSELSLKEIQKEWHGSLKTYLIGFIASLVLTAISFALAWMDLFSKTTLIYILIVLALLQAGVQLIFFLHVGQEPKPRWESVVFGFMAVILLIVVLGTLWVMHDLDERTMSHMSTMPDAHNELKQDVKEVSPKEVSND